jgi:hypothetical protein
VAAVISVHVEFEMVGAHVDHVINWLAGWLYRRGYIFSECRSSGSLRVDVYARRVCRSVTPVDVFDFTLDIIDDMYCFLSEVGNFDLTVSVCGGKECVYVDWDDVRRLREEEYEEIERRWDIIAGMAARGGP